MIKLFKFSEIDAEVYNFTIFLVFKRKKRTQCFLWALRFMENRQTSNLLTKMKTLRPIDAFWYLKLSFEWCRNHFKIFWKKIPNRDFSHQNLKRVVKNKLIWKMLKFQFLNCLVYNYGNLWYYFKNQQLNFVEIW